MGMTLHVISAHLHCGSFGMMTPRLDLATLLLVRVLDNAALADWAAALD
jgi:hypothetical protein